jgi:hypothetical protein
MNLFDYLKKEGFIIVEKNISNSFGDYYFVFSRNDIELRLIKDRSQMAVDVRNVIEQKENWFDISLVKALITNDTTQLNYPWTIEQYMDFLINNMSELLILFNTENYMSTGDSLNKIMDERTKQIFSILN